MTLKEWVAKNGEPTLLCPKCENGLMGIDYEKEQFQCFYCMKIIKVAQPTLTDEENAQ